MLVVTMREAHVQQLATRADIERIERLLEARSQQLTLLLGTALCAIAFAAVVLL